MAESYKDITGAIVLSASVKAKEGKADELEQLFAIEKARADSDAEPGTLSFDLVRYENSFAAWIKYRDSDAAETHFNNQSSAYRKFLADGFGEEPVIVFYPADSLPAPTKKQ